MPVLPAAPATTPAPKAAAASKVGRSNSAPTLVPKARHSSHMLPSFTAQLDLQRDIAEQKRKRDEERIQSEKRLQHTVFVYSWLASNTGARSRVYQAGANGVYFVVGKDVFAQADLFEALGQAKVEVYFEALGSWTHIGLDYTIALKHKHHHIYLRHEDALITLGLEDHLRAAEAANSHVRTNLAPERSYSREVYKKSPQSTPPLQTPPGPLTPQQAVTIPTQSSKRRHESPPLSPGLVAAKKESSARALPPPSTRPTPRPVLKKLKLEPTTHVPALPSTRPAPPPPTLTKIKSEVKSEPKLEPKKSFSPIDLTVHSSPSPSPSPPPSPGPSSRLRTGGGQGDAIEVDSDLEYTSWLADYPVYKIAAFLHEIKTIPRSTKRQPQPSHASIFNRYFPDAEYHKSTVNDQARKYRRAPQELKQEALAAKDGHLGMWSTFSSNIRLHRKATRAAANPTGMFTDPTDIIDLT